MTVIDMAEFAASPKVGRPAPVVRFASAADPTATSDKNTFGFVFSDETVDRCGVVLAASGCVLDNFNKNPIITFGGDASRIDNVMGRAKNVRVMGSRLIGQIEFLGAGINPKAETVRQMVAGGYLKSVDVSIIVLELQQSKKRKGGVDVPRWELLSIDIVPIPANPNAVALAMAAGVDVARLGLPAPEDRYGLAAPSCQRNTAMPAASASRRYPAAQTISRQSPATVPASPASARWPGGLGEFLRAIVATADGTAEPDPRLIRSPSGLSETDGAGVDLLAPEFLPAIIEPIFDGEALVAPWCRRFRMQMPSASIPGVDETSRLNGSRWGGVTSTWLAEGTTIPASFFRSKNIEFVAHKLAAILPATREIMADISMFSEYARRPLGRYGVPARCGDHLWERRRRPGGFAQHVGVDHGPQGQRPGDQDDHSK